MKRTWLRPGATVLLAAALTVFGTGCGSTSGGNGGSTGKQLTIGALWLDEQGFYAGVKKGIETGAASSKVKLLGNNSKGDPSLEAQYMQTLIDSGVDAIIMSAVSEDSSKALIQKAHDKGIPVICYNTCIKKADADSLVYAWITGDHTQQGGAVGTAMGKYFVDKKVAAPKIGIVSCEQYEACKQRHTGFETELKKLVPGAQIVATQQGLTLDEATRVATDMLTAHPDLDAIYGEAESMSVGSVKAIEATNHVGKTVVFGHDIATDTAQLLQKGDVLKYINAMMAQDFGKTAIQEALKAINKEPKGQTVIPMNPVDFNASDTAKVTAWLSEHADGIP
jgi:simple sugar transport system substrate-binding protein